MLSYGKEEHWDGNGFKVICSKCGKEARLIHASHFKNDEYRFPEKITLILRCACGNMYDTGIRLRD